MPINQELVKIIMIYPYNLCLLKHEENLHVAN